MKDRIINAPDRIWLNYGPGIVGEVDHKDCREMSWHDEPLDPTDVEYVRADLIDGLQIAVEAVVQHWDKPTLTANGYITFDKLLRALREAVQEAKAKVSK